MKKNKCDILLESIDAVDPKFKFDEMPYRSEFIHLCNIIPTQNLELKKLKIEPIEHDLIDRKGFVYSMVINNLIIKIGQTTTDINGRIQSYNCGQQKYREAGTCSTTNYFTLQSLCNINMPVELYAYFPGKLKTTIFGKKVELIAPSKDAEKILLKKVFEHYGSFPIGNTQG